MKTQLAKRFGASVARLFTSIQTAILTLSQFLIANNDRNYH